MDNTIYVYATSACAALYLFWTWSIFDGHILIDNASIKQYTRSLIMLHFFNEYIIALPSKITDIRSDF